MNRRAREYLYDRTARPESLYELEGVFSTKANENSKNFIRPVERKHNIDGLNRVESWKVRMSLWAHLIAREPVYTLAYPLYIATTNRTCILWQNKNLRWEKIKKQSDILFLIHGDELFLNGKKFTFSKRKKVHGDEHFLNGKKFIVMKFFHTIFLFLFRIVFIVLNFS